jgi:hypothetical protein
MYVTQNFLAFSGWPDTRVLLPLVDVKHVEKSTTLLYVPNAIIVKMEDDEEYFFASFLDRDQCYNLLVRISEVARRLHELHGSNPQVTGRGLIFGFQSNFTSLAGNAAAGAIMNAFSGGSTSQPIVDTTTTIPSNNKKEGAPSASTASEQQPNNAMMSSNGGSKLSPSNGTSTATPTATAPASSSSSSYSNIFMPISENSAGAYLAPSSSSTASPATTATSTSTPATAPAVVRPVPKAVRPTVHDVKIENLFQKHGIILLGNYNLDACSPAHLFRSFWMPCNGYVDFLSSLGDFDISMTEWTAVGKTPIAEDIMKLPFQYTRDLNYLHPRTTFLMFGPKNATGIQKQYLYLTPSDDGSGTAIDKLSSSQPWQGIVMTVTELQGVPMCELFRVVVYWSFEPSGKDMTISNVRIGLNIHMLKPSLFKSQIIGGTKEELDEQAKRWNAYMQGFLEQNPEPESGVGQTLSISSNLVSNSPAGSLTVDTPANRIRRRSSRSEAIELSSAQQTKASTATPAPTATATSVEFMPKSRLYAILVACVAIIWWQWSANSALKNQLNEVSRRIKSIEENVSSQGKTQQQILLELARRSSHDSNNANQS